MLDNQLIAQNRWQALLGWYAIHGRRLPWRQTEDPYAIWISEIVFQQTRVEQGTGHYLRFLKAFPTVQQLAAAPLAQVLKAWEGLGYYTRAHSLHRAAQLVVAEYGGQLPREPEQLMQLPGIGPYAARAIAAFAWNHPSAALDGNVFRIISRADALDTPINIPAARALYQQRADAWLAGCPDPRGYNSAIMDLGALVCSPRSPKCGSCPLQPGCQACAAGTQQQYPRKNPKPEKPTRTLAMYVVSDTIGHLGILRRPDKGLWPGLYELPNLPVPLHGAALWFGFRHTFTHFHYQVQVYRVPAGVYPELDAQIQVWADVAEIRTFAFSKVANVILDRLNTPAQESLFS